MKGDFSRDTFDPTRHFSQVLMQQGRVQLDADWNEQGAIMLHALRSLVVDLVGPAWAVGTGFDLAMDENGKDFIVAGGRYYVDGIACDNAADLHFLSQPGVPPEQRKWNTGLFYLVYVDAWEQLVTSVEDGAIREVALGGPDTAARAQVAWQVRLLPFQLNADGSGKPANCVGARALLAKQLATTRPRLRAWAVDNADDAPCEIAPDAAYRGLENQLYRVEIHDPGSLADNAGAPSFKWSRENGAVVFPVTGLVPGKEQVTVTLAHLGRDDRLGLSRGDWVELVDDAYLRQERHDALLRVIDIDPEDMTVTLAGDAGERVANPAYRLLRRWDQRDDVNGAGLVVVQESDGADAHPFVLEDGVTVQFEKGGAYRTGDYWLIPARSATGNVEWPVSLEPGGAARPEAVPARGVEHHYGLLGVLANGGGWKIKGCRCAVPAGFASCPA